MAESTLMKFPQRRIVMMERAAQASRGASTILRDKGHTVLVSQSKADILDMIESCPRDIDVVVIDASVIEHEALAVMNEVRRMSGCVQIPVIRCAVAPTEAQIVRGLNAGFWQYVSVPCSRELLLAVVEAVATDHERHRRLHAEYEQSSRVFEGMTEATFRFRTLEDVESVARLVSSSCPAPDRVIVGLSELMINAIEHGNLGIGYELKSKINASGTWLEEIKRRLAAPEQADRFATLTFTRTRTEATFCIEDRGHGFDWRPYLDISTKRTSESHGRGIAIARELSFDVLEYSPPGNVVRAIVRAQGAVATRPEN